MLRHSLRPSALALPAAALAVALPALASAQAPAWSPAASPAQTQVAPPAAATTPAPTQGPAAAPAASTGDSGGTTAGQAAQAAQAPAEPRATSPTPMPESHMPPPEHGMGHPYYPGQGRPAQAGRGFVMSAAFGIQPLVIPVLSAGSNDQSITAITSTGIAGQLAIGYKFGRAILSLGLNLGSVFDKRSLDSLASTSFMVVPGLQVALVRSRDQRAELIGVMRFGAGATIPSNSSLTGSKPDTLLFYEIAPGARYWMHTQFAMQFTAGFAGQLLLSNNVLAGEIVAAHGLSAALGAVGIF